jgi:hypothetical protein
MFTVSAKMKRQDTWFLLLISAIVAHLRYVGDIKGFGTAKKPFFKAGTHSFRAITEATNPDILFDNKKYSLQNNKSGFYLTERTAFTWF